MVIHAVQMAVWQRQGSDPAILHSDRGSQFRSGDYLAYLKTNGLVCSMSAVGHCVDKAACEGFFGVLKREPVYRTKYPTLNAARTDVFEYIERFHSPRMRRRTASQDLKPPLFTIVRDFGVEPRDACVLPRQSPKRSSHAAAVAIHAHPRSFTKTADRCERSPFCRVGKYRQPLRHRSQSIMHKHPEHLLAVAIDA